MSRAIRHSLKNGKKGKHWENTVGYTTEDLKEHLENKFIENMDWKKFLSGEIHIDHIKPISSFEYLSYEDEKFKICWSLSNLQPLWKIDNLKKSNKIGENNGNIS